MSPVWNSFSLHNASVQLPESKKSLQFHFHDIFSSKNLTFLSILWGPLLPISETLTVLLLPKKIICVQRNKNIFMDIEMGIISSFCLLQKKTNLKDAASSFYFSLLHCCRYIWLQEINKVKQTWFTLEKIRCNKSQKDFLECSFQMQIHKDALLSSKYTISSFQTTLSTWIIFLSLLYLLQFLLKCWIFIGNHLDL